MEKLIFPVSVTQKEQLSEVFIFEFDFDANLRHPTAVHKVIIKIFIQESIFDAGGRILEYFRT